MNATELEQLEQLRRRVAELEAKVERAEQAWLRFLGGAGKRILKVLGVDARELRP